MTTQHLRHIHSPEGVAPATGYTHVVTGTGRFVAVSGQLALDGNGALVGPGDPLAQARQVFANLRRCLAAAGATFDDVVKLTYYMADVAHLAETAIARNEVMDPTRLPASSAFQVVSLVSPDFLMEIEAFAIVPPDRKQPPS
ncbi:RidA family protein [Streptomyces clavuligerus]|uniref:Endoribonuclease L-PSP n=2 Tax=Streptomyces clavuligerus TaxID=1901 RepID=E2Q700_STRCL|nr:RidA family protein [Streptomyces clavuligerus]ANW21581.1 enamine deaminase RidA [Streptomyces clavuligerus]AXU16210.1 RidA family protein [Streptomyces clavuligerus]EFG05247.1 endoribonuclease L-PSP [Streptomyces clavuligerus]MBY6306365.1 RidA family protein [Streptomyces clavuligerus]QCS08989.1 RidA family protein [Streptomyces clavuligerus]